MTILPLPIISFLYYWVYEPTVECIDFIKKYSIEKLIILYEIGCIMYAIGILFVVKPCAEFRTTGLYVWSICQLCIWCMFTIAHILFIVMNVEVG